MRFRACCGSLVLGCLVACTESSEELKGRLFVAPIAGADGTAVGLSVDFIPTAGDEDDVQTVELKVVAHGANFVTASSQTFCLRFPDSGRLSLLADPNLPASARIVLTAHRPPEAVPLGAAGAPGDAVAQTLPKLSCQGMILDDAVWPTRGAQVNPLPGSGGAAGSPTTDGASETVTSSTSGGTATNSTTTNGTTGGSGGTAGAAGAAGATP